MKHISLLVILLGWTFSLNAQPFGCPDWITHKPIPSNNTFYYRVTMGEGANYDKAYANAVAKAILESSWKLGLPVNTEDDLKVIENGVLDNITINKSEMNLSMNKVCEYSERMKEKKGTRIYILWQVATSGNVRPLFDEFSNCE